MLWPASAATADRPAAGPTGVLLGLVLVCVAAALALHLPMALNHDVAWILQGSQRILEGARFGRDIEDVNPPLAWWILLAPAALSQATGLSLGTSCKLFIAGLAVASLALCSALSGGRGGAERWALLPALAAVCLILPGYDYGQREHIMLILSMPYVVGAAIRAEGRTVPPGLAITVGALAGAGLALKPHFVAIPALVELWLLCRSRRPVLCFRPETLAIAGAAVVYLVAVWLFAPDYLFVIVPDALVGYGAYDQNWADILRATAIFIFPSLAALGLAIAAVETHHRPDGACWRPGSAPPYMMAFTMAGVGALVAALVQRKGWDYHLLPALGFLLVAAAVRVLSPGTEYRLRPAAFAACAVLLIALASAPLALLRDRFSETGTEATVRALAALFSDHAGPRGTVYGFITSPRDVHPAVVLAGSRWASAPGSLYLLPAAVRDNGDPRLKQRREAAAARQEKRVLSDLIAAPPAVIVVDAAPHKLAFGNYPFDYVDHFLQKPGFAALWRNYREASPIGRFRVFIRRGGN